MKHKLERGFTLLELLIVIAISTIIAIAAAPAVVWKIEEAGMEATGVYMNILKSSLEKYNITNHDALVTGLPVTGFATPLAPTVDELIAAKYISSPSFPNYTPQRVPVKTQIVLQSCPGPNCRLFGIGYTTKAQTYVGTTDIRYDLVASYLASPGAAGAGAASQQGSEGVLRSSSFTVPNPVPGTPGGIIAIGTYLDEGIYANFVRLQDTRDPDLRGGMTLTGLLPDGNTLDVNGNVKVTGKTDFLDDVTMTDAGSGTVCVKLYKAGQVDVNCNGILNAKAGTFTGPLGVVKVGDTGVGYTIDSTGKVRGQAGFYTALNSVFGDNSLGVRMAGSVFTVQTASAVDALALHDDGRLGARTSQTSPILGLSNPVAAGSACGSAAAQAPATNATNAATTTLRALVGGGVAICANGAWTPVVQTGTLGGPCSPDGATATDPSGASLFCTGGFYVSLADRFGSLVFSDSQVVSDGGNVLKPFCASGSTASRIYLIPENEVQTAQYVNRYSQDAGSSWNVFMRTGLNAPISGAMIAQTYCAY